VILRARKPVLWLVPLGAAAVASFAIVGADCRWLVALGGALFDGHWPSSLPFATAPTSGWRNVPALAELVLRALWRLFGDRGLAGAQIVAAAAAFAALAVGLRRERRGEAGVVVVSLLVVLCSLPALVVIRNGLFSLALFPLLLLLLERESREPSRRIWLAVPLLALWSNLHGGVLVGYALLAVYAVLARRRLALGLLVAGALALCATPVLWHTPEYYWHASRNEAARRGLALWAPLGTGAFDVVLVVAVLALLALALVPAGRAWQRWETVAVVGLILATVHTARLGTFLAFVLAYPAARAVELRRPATVPLVVPAILAGIALAGLVRTPYDAGSSRLAREAAATGQPVLADGVLAEQVELAGGKVWVADPIDAFSSADQNLYLDWLAGNADGAAAVGHARLVLLRRAGPAGRIAAADHRLARIDEDANAVLYRVASP
jgi:hypothetical protein